MSVGMSCNDVVLCSTVTYGAAFDFLRRNKVYKGEACKKHGVCQKKNIPLLKHHLLPRTKGFTIATNGLRSKIKAVYDVTVAWEDGIELTLADMVAGKACVNSCLIRRIPIEDIPVDDDKSGEFLHQIYREKDELCEFHMKNNRFPSVEEAEKLGVQYYKDVEHRPIQRRVRNLIMCILWILLTLHFFIQITSYVFSSLSLMSLSVFATLFGIVAALFYVMMQAGKPQSSYGK